VAINPAGTRAYVSNSGGMPVGNTVTVIDTSTNSAIDTITVGLQPQDIALSSDGARAYVTNSSSNSVSVIDTTTSAVIGTVAVGDYPEGVAVHPSNGRIYVANNGNTVSVINSNTLTVVNTITMPANSGTVDIRIAPNGSRAYVTHYSTGTISVIDIATESIIATITLPPGSHPVRLAIAHDNSRLYVSDGTSGSGPLTNDVFVVDTASNTQVGTITVDNDPTYLVLNSSGTRLYVAAQQTGAVSVVDTASNTTIATIGGIPAAQGVAVKP
jgi:YVTN family beta-propeller protein